MKTNNDQLLIDQFLTKHRDIAMAAIEELKIDEIALLIENVAPDKSTTILSNLSPYKAGKVLEKVSFKHAINFVGLLPTNISESILRITSLSFRKQVLTELPSSVRNHLKRSFTFSKNQVGAHLEPGFFTLSESHTIEKVLLEIKTTKAIVQPLIFVLDKTKTLVGYIEATDLLSNVPHKTIQSIMKPVSHAIVADMLVKDVLENWNDSFVYLPVVKGEGQFVGIVSRSSLSELKLTKIGTNNSTIRAGSALGDLYLIGLTSLLGSSDQNTNS